MGKSLVVAVSVSLLLSACAAGRIGDSGYSRFLVSEPLPAKPNVFVRGDRYLVVDQEPIVVAGDAEVVTFALDAAGPWTFPREGAIAVSPLREGRAANVADCAVTGAANRQLTCTFKLERGQKIAYTLTVQDGSGKTIKSDPTAVRPL
jgi:hypothetical protein